MLWGKVYTKAYEDWRSSLYEETLWGKVCKKAYEAWRPSLYEETLWGKVYKKSYEAWRSSLYEELLWGKVYKKAYEAILEAKESPHSRAISGNLLSLVRLRTYPHFRRYGVTITAFYAFYAFYAWWFPWHFPQSGALAAGTTVHHGQQLASMTKHDTQAGESGLLVTVFPAGHNDITIILVLSRTSCLGW